MNNFYLRQNSALKCYGEGTLKGQPLTEEECIDEKGCMAALECLNKKEETFTGGND
jgi:hypothetical protein